MPRPVKVGRKERMTFAKINEVCEMPNLIDVQTQSYKWFVEEGLSEVLEDVSQSGIQRIPSVSSSPTTIFPKKPNIVRKNVKNGRPRMQHLLR